MNKESFYLSMEEDRIVGCLGTYYSSEQKVVRLLGPIILPEYFVQSIDLLYKSCLKELPEDIKEIKIAFFEENQLCKEWCDKHGFELYTASDR